MGSSYTNRSDFQTKVRSLASCIIRLSGNSRWGTAFATKIGDETVFFSAKHVLEDIGIPSTSNTAEIEMCDGSRKFLSGVQVFSIYDIDWCACGDLVRFHSDFPAKVLNAGLALPNPHEEVFVVGYGFTVDCCMPDCGIITDISGTVLGSVSLSCPERYHQIQMDLLWCDTNHNGMSGGPVFCLSENEVTVFAVYNGSAIVDGGVPYLATSIF